jgi:hypothetical protein
MAHRALPILSISYLLMRSWSQPTAEERRAREEGQETRRPLQMGRSVYTITPYHHPYPSCCTPCHSNPHRATPHLAPPYHATPVWCRPQHPHQEPLSPIPTVPPILTNHTLPHPHPQRHPNYPNHLNHPNHPIASSTNHPSPTAQPAGA